MRMSSYRLARERGVTLFIIFTSVTLLTSCSREQEAPAAREVIRPVKTMVILGPEGTRSRQFPGSVRAADRVDLAFQVHGPLIELPIKQGETVKKGQLLARLDPRDFQSNVNSAEAQFTEANANYERGKELVKDGFISKSEFDKLKARFDVARADRNIAKKALEDTRLRAPFSGVVARRYVDNFQDVRAKQEIMSLQDISTIEIVVDAPERVVAKTGGEVTAKLVALFESAPGRQYELELKEFATEADPKTQTFQYVLTMPQPDNSNILPGMTATVLATRSQAKKASDEPEIYVIPALAVFADEGGRSHVWVVKPETTTVTRRQVTTGDLTGTESIQIVDGLSSGDMIAVAGVTQLREGMKIRPVEKVEF